MEIKPSDSQPTDKEPALGVRVILMNLFVATVLSLALLASASAQTNQATPASRTGAASAQPRPSQRAIGDFSPKLAALSDEVLYGDVWERPQFSKRDRSLVTVAALIAMNRPNQLRSHLARGRDNGVTQEELIETFTHMAVYAGWPSAITAISVAREVFQQK
jgi:4-carboxymuconolactone decarboxylase